MATATEVQKDIVLEPKVYELPSAELHTATITKVEDLGVVKSELYGDQKKLKLYYKITDQKSSKNEDLYVFETCTQSIGEKSRLGKRLISLGIDIAGPVHVSEIVGMNVTVGIIHNTKGNKTYANVDYVSPIKAKRVATEV